MNLNSMSVKLILPALLLIASGAYAQKKVVVAEFKTSAVCGMCKKTLEEGIIYEKGVKKSNLDVDSKIFKVWYREDKTNEEKLRTAISLLGYDADTVAADPKAYDNLHPCCKKDFAGHKEENHEEHGAH